MSCVLQHGEIAVGVQGPLASSSSFVQQKNGNVTSATLCCTAVLGVFYPRCSQNNCLSVPKPLIAGGDIFVCGSHLFFASVLFFCGCMSLTSGC